MDTKQKVTYGVVAVVVGIIVWQVYGMVAGDDSVETAMNTPTVRPNPDIPKPAALIPDQSAKQSAEQTPAMTEREMQLTKLQQETQAKYLAALDELQMLKVEKDIADANKDISKAKMETVFNQKSIVDMLNPPRASPTTEAYAQTLDSTGAPSVGGTAGAVPGQQTSAAASASTYTVVSVSRIGGVWMAVIGSQGKLYSVRQGDVLAADNSIVQTIDNSGVQLEKDGKKQKISMMPII